MTNEPIFKFTGTYFDTDVTRLKMLAHDKIMGLNIIVTRSQVNIKDGFIHTEKEFFMESLRPEDKPEEFEPGFMAHVYAEGW